MDDNCLLVQKWKEGKMNSPTPPYPPKKIFITWNVIKLHVLVNV